MGDGPWIGAAVLLSLSLGLRPPAQQPAPPTPSVDAIVERSLAASGGRKAWTKIVSMHARGTMELPAPSAPVQFEFFAKAPDRLLRVFTLADGSTMRQGFDGKHAWRNDPGHDVEDVKGPALEDLKQQAEFHTDLHLREIYSEMEYLGEQDVGGYHVYVIAADGQDGLRHKHYFDLATGLRVGMSTDATVPEATPDSTIYSDFRDVGGVKVPFIFQMTSPTRIMTLRFRNIVANERIPDSVFAKPAPGK